MKFIINIFKRITCTHEEITLKYKGMCIDRYRCNNCGKDFIVKKGESL